MSRSRDKKRAVDILSDDATKLIKGLTKKSNEQDKRAFVRATFAYIEAAIWSIKQEFLDTYHSGCSVAELAILNEESYFIEESGKPVIKPARISFLSNLRFALWIWSSRTRFKPDFSGVGWGALRRSTKVRDRLTHPNRAEELDVSDEEIRDVMKTHAWFVTHWIKIWEIVVELGQARHHVYKTAVKAFEKHDTTIKAITRGKGLRPEHLKSFAKFLTPAELMAIELVYAEVVAEQRNGSALPPA